ncbi:hypothetical protein VTJ04DRAFT_9150 [Mycothermus thermophilus]|uniref:uncharacterized protein n=1 Tax=Humicola insolens TaxID=85995 RepID=UPI003743E23C
MHSRQQGRLAAFLGFLVYGTTQVDAVSANITYPQTVTISLVFPRNETYTTGAIFPAIWAIHNAPAIATTVNAPTLSWQLWRPEGNPKTDARVVYSGDTGPGFFSTYKNDAIPVDQWPNIYYYADYVSKVSFNGNMTGHWRFSWAFITRRYDSNSTHDVIDVPAMEYSGEVVEFTIVDPSSSSSSSSTARDPMDFTSTQSDTCPSWPGISFDITRVIRHGESPVHHFPVIPMPSDADELDDTIPHDPVLWSTLYGSGITSTTTTTTTTPTITIATATSGLSHAATTNPVLESPCLVTMDASAAESISSTLTRMVCAYETSSLPAEVCYSATSIPTDNAAAASPGVVGGGLSMVGVVVVSLAWVIGGALMFAL